MGNNSGSMHNLASLDDHHFHQRLVGQHHHQHHSHHHQQLKQQQHQQQWTTQSMPRPLHPQIKVFPDNVPGTKGLRTTNNGAILNNGGTLTNRKDLPGVQRSKSISAPHQNIHHPPHPNMGAMRQRSTTQINMLEERENRMNNYKRFGSEPDLRQSGDEENVNTAAQKGRAKIMKGKKKKTAPAPPPTKHESDYDPSRFGWKPKTNGFQAPPPPVQELPPRKLRLFKTKAESKKTTTQVKIATEASDQHFRHRERSENFRVIEQQPRDTVQHHNQPDADRISEDLEWNQQSRARIIPMPHFRREKSFDVSILSERSNQMENYLRNRRQRVPSPLESRKISNPNYPAQPVAKPPPEPPKNLRKIKEDSKDKLRKVSQQVKNRASNGGPSFQQELLEATKRRSVKVEQKVINTEPKQIIESIKPLPRTKLKKETTSPSHKLANPKPILPELKPKTSELKTRSNVEKEKLPRKISNNNSTPAKKFYFGMDENAEPELMETIMDKTQLDAIDRFAESLMKRKATQMQNDSSESALSSDVEDGYYENGQHEDNIIPEGEDSRGISLQLRPTLPKKQFEIPRFSPSAAWRLLAPEDDQKESAKFYHPEKLNLEPLGTRQHCEMNGLEDRIERIYQAPVPGLPDNKSGDSGISGDAGLPDRNDSPRQNGTSSSKNIEPFVSAWTPQQDLEESSSDEAHNTSELKEEITHLQGTRGHVFSLSLPREVHLSQFSDKSEKQSFTTNSLQKLKKTVSSAFQSNSTNEKVETRNDNWLLSRSAPNSIDNCKKPLTLHSSVEFDQEELDSKPPHISPHLNNKLYNPSIAPPSFGYLTSGRHMMYLPNHPVGESSDYKSIEYYDKPPVEETHETRESLQDPPEFNEPITSVQNTKHSELQLVQLFQDYHKPAKSKSKNHRFTFQSTVRQIERRKIADKLSKEAEYKEAQRISELEAMRRVEEEFQKKRAREKASIRQQLRLYSMEENQFTSLPVEWNENSRAEPDGAVSSPTESPMPVKSNSKFVTSDDFEKHDADSYVDTKTPYISRIVEQKSSKYNRVSGEIQRAPLPTEILSEFHTTRREYMEYRGGINNRRAESPAVSSSHSGNRTKATEHPKIVCNIPSSRGTSNGFGVVDDLPLSDNYRRDFACGGRSINSSDSEISAPSLHGYDGKYDGVGSKPRQRRSRSPSPIQLTSHC